jgi:hypothetical protein
LFELLNELPPTIVDEFEDDKKEPSDFYYWNPPKIILLELFLLASI